MLEILSNAVPSALSNIVPGVIGTLLILVVLNDFIHTTVRLEGGGRLSNPLMSVTWRAALFLQQRFPRHRVLPNAGVAALLANIAMWTVLLWLGWLLLFLPQADAVLTSGTGEPAGFWARVYFVGFSLITLGVGDYTPGSAFFQIATVLAAVTGFFLLTLSVTYLIPVTSAVVESRQLAARILLLGRNPPETVAHVVVRERGDDRLELLLDFVGPIVLLSQRHFAYPVLKYFPSSRRNTSVAVAFAVLDESLTILLHGLNDRDDEPALVPLRRALGEYLEIQVAPGGERLPPVPPPPTLEPLRAAGFDTVANEEFGRRIASEAHRRRLLRRLLHRENRDWDEVDASLRGSEPSKSLL